MSRYKCTECGYEFEEKEKNCPNCGAKQYYCHAHGCDKQLVDGSHKYCAIHNGKRHQTAKKVGFVLVLVFLFLPFLVLLTLVSKGKINIKDIIKGILGKK